MCPIPYFTTLRNSKDPRHFRYALVRFAREHGVKPAARAFATTPKTVRKWLRRSKEGSLDGLADHSRAPKRPHRRIPPLVRARVITLKKKLPPWGAARLRRDYDLPLSEKAIRRIWREEGLLKKKRRKHKTKQDLRAVKAQWKLFEQTSLDTKDLDDIPEMLFPIRRFGLPVVQYTAREVVSGLQFLAYADERALCYASLFAELLLEHFQACGVELRGCRFQSDNGSEFIGSWQAKRDSAFTRTVEAVEGLEHHTIPPGAHTWQADVETVHRLIEDEFYEVEIFRSRGEFLEKASAYNVWFNVARKNSYKQNKTPWEIVHERAPTLSPRIAMWRPVFLDKILAARLDSKPQGGYHVVPYP